MSEGVDYTENILNAVVCVGLPLPPPSARQDALLEYYSARFGRSKAWKYASLQPAVNSVLQALGRPIRKKEDRSKKEKEKTRTQKKGRKKKEEGSRERREPAEQGPALYTPTSRSPAPAEIINNDNNN